MQTDVPTGAQPQARRDPRPVPDVRTERRPWGRFERFTLNEPSTVKIIHVEPGSGSASSGTATATSCGSRSTPARCSRWPGAASSRRWGSGC